VTTFLLISSGYLLGSVPFAFFIAWLTGRVDLREVGSGNVGATNVLRVAGISAGVVAAFFDIGKGVAIVVIARWLGSTTPACAWAGVAAVVGHVYPVWLKFRGGKGVATTCGVFAVLAPLGTLLTVVIFGLVVLLTRVVSVGSMIAAICLGPFAYAMGASTSVVRAAFFAGSVVLFSHRGNLIRLAAGAEYKLGQNASDEGKAR